MTELSTEQLQTLQVKADSTLTSLIESLNERPDIQEALRSMRTPDDVLETCSELELKDADLMRIISQACVMSLVNLRRSRAVTAELKRRAEAN